MFKRIASICSIALLGSVVGVGAAHADVIYKITVDNCTGTCGNPTSLGAGVFATVELHQSGSNVVVTETLATGENFAGTGSGDALEFNLKSTSAGTIDVLSLPTGFIVGPSPDTASGFGTFTNSVTCTKVTPGGCQGGNGPVGPLVFTVDNALITDFISNTDKYFFSSDILGVNGKTGPVGGNSGGTPVTPEPSSLLLMGTGILGAAGLFYRRVSRAEVVQK